MLNEKHILTRDCTVTLIPAGDEVRLPEGTQVDVVQALGGSVTVRCDLGTFRLSSNNLDALGDEAARFIEAQSTTEQLQDKPFSEELVWDSLKQCFDPEIPINIVDLGLIYDLAITELEDKSYQVNVKMTLTAQGCGMGPTIAADAKAKIEAIPAVTQAEVDIVWDPVWTPHMISESGKKQLGLS